MGVGDGIDQNNRQRHNKEYPKEPTHRQDRFACHLCLEGTTHALILANIDIVMLLALLLDYRPRESFTFEFLRVGYL